MPEWAKLNTIEDGNTAEFNTVGLSSIASINGLTTPSQGLWNGAIDYGVILEVIDTTEMNRTESGTATDLTKQTISVWVKRSKLGGTYTIFDGNLNSTNNRSMFSFATDSLHISYTTGGTASSFISTARFRDTSKFYHIVLSWDSTSATAADRIPLVWVNGYSIADDLGGWSTETNNIAQNDVTYFQNGTGTNNNTIAGRNQGGAFQFSGVMCDFICVDGQALTATSFGEFSQSIWIPKSYAGTYGNLGLHLDFSDNTDYGNDVSGNNNDFTDQNLGTDHQTLDTPEDTYCVLDFNNHRYNSNVVLKEGGLFMSDSLSSHEIACGTFAMRTGKWYWEVDVGTDLDNSAYGVLNSNWLSAGQFTWAPGNVQTDADIWTFWCDGTGGNYEKYNNDGGTADTNLSAPSSNDIVMIAFDADNNKLFFGVNGTWANFGSGVGDPAAGTNAAYTNLDSSQYQIVPYGVAVSNTTGITFNFGQRTYSYTPPTGFTALCTSNLPEPTYGVEVIVDDKSSAAVIWTGDGNANKSITGVGFQPDFVWIKNRDTTDVHNLYDVDRGVTKYLNSNDAASGETTDADDGLDSFDSDGFSIGYNSLGITNNSGDDYVAWCLKENLNAGIEILTYTGNGNASRTISHNLGAVPRMIIVREYGAGGSWYVYHWANNARTDPEDYYWTLEGSAANVDSANTWNDTAPTSSVFTVAWPSADRWTNLSGATYVAYLFTDVEGCTNCFSFMGNGATTDYNGTYVHLGFRPEWMIFKASAYFLGDPVIIDSARHVYNISTETAMSRSSTDAADSSVALDFYANGFKCRENEADVNLNAQNMCGVAFAKAPYKYANAV
jgi:hypothetical protein